MLTFLSTFMSFLMGGLPRILEIFQDMQDKKQERELARLQQAHEREMMAMGFAAQARIEEMRTEQVYAQAQAESIASAHRHDEKLGDGVRPWVKDLRGSVRPIVTYLFVLELIAINVFTLGWLMGWWGTNPPEVGFVEAMGQVFSDDEMQIVSSIVAFWFGTQAFKK